MNNRLASLPASFSSTSSNDTDVEAGIVESMS